jgi:hypothetical protein
MFVNERPSRLRFMWYCYCLMLMLMSFFSFSLVFPMNRLYSNEIAAFRKHILWKRKSHLWLVDKD